MKKLVTIFLIFLVLSGCSNSKKENNEPEKKSLTFEAYINEGETFEFTLDPQEAVSYQELKDKTTEADISASNWRSYFDIKEVYREHYEYDDRKEKSQSYMAGNVAMIVLNDEYIYADNWSRNNLEWEVFVDGEETRTMIDGGKTYDPVIKEYFDIQKYSGADAMLIMTDFINSWDENTQEKYEGHLSSYDMISCSGHVKLLDSSLISFKQLKDDIYFFAAYGSDEDFFVLFVENDDAGIERESEYNAAIYETSPYGEVERGRASINMPIWEAYIELMNKVDKQ
ncbi:MAG: hypothetical protein IKF80_07190 [Erysipelotrichaceae bacterium]|nr:hypothetical protein [Erysipelotrichaceae bacterium]